MTAPFRTMADAVRANRDAGQHFFSEGAMRFFASKVESMLYRGHWFVTSEHPDGNAEAPESERVFTVRYIRDDGEVDNVGEFMQHQHIADAMAALWADINSRINAAHEKEHHDDDDTPVG